MPSASVQRCTATERAGACAATPRHAVLGESGDPEACGARSSAGAEAGALEVSSARGSTGAGMAISPPAAGGCRSSRSAPPQAPSSAHTTASTATRATRLWTPNVESRSARFFGCEETLEHGRPVNDRWPTIRALQSGTNTFADGAAIGRPTVENRRSDEPLFACDSINSTHSRQGASQALPTPQPVGA